MAYWKIGVGIPLRNNSFKYGRRVKGLLDGTWTSGLTFSIDNTTGDDDGHSEALQQYLHPGDKIVVGPSTYADYEGETQTFTIASVGGSALTVEETLQVLFADNDGFSGIGSKMPAGWKTTDSLQSERLYDLVSPYPSMPVRGPNDRFRVLIRLPASISPGTLFQDIEVPDYYLTSLNHRYGFSYAANLTSDTATLSHGLTDSGGVWGGSADSFSLADQLTWAEFNNVETSNSSIGTSWQFFLLLIHSSGVNNLDMAFDNVYLEHAAGTDDEANGVYTFDDYPAFGSRKFGYVRGSNLTRLRNNSLIISDPAGGGDRSRKLKIQAGYNDVTKTLRDQLEILMEWQQRGWPLVLHHDIPSAESHIYGFMTLQDTSLKHWSSDKVSFNLMFEEM